MVVIFSCAYGNPYRIVVKAQLYKRSHGTLPSAALLLSMIKFKLLNYETRASVTNPGLPHTLIDFVFITEILVMRYCYVRTAEEPPLTKGPNTLSNDLRKSAAQIRQTTLVQWLVSP